MCVWGNGNIPDFGLHVRCGQNLWSKPEKARAHPAPSLLGPSVGGIPFWPSVLVPGVVTVTLVAAVVDLSLSFFKKGVCMHVCIYVHVYDVCVHSFVCM